MALVVAVMALAVAEMQEKVVTKETAAAAMGEGEAAKVVAGGGMEVAVIPLAVEVTAKVEVVGIGR